MYQWKVSYHKDERLPTNLPLFLTEINFFSDLTLSRAQGVFVTCFLSISIII